MRKVLIILGFIFAVIGIVFAILPMGTLGVLFAGPAIVFAVLAFVKSPDGERNVPKWLLIISCLTLLVILVRSFVPDEVEKDDQFEQKKIESKQEDIKELEELDALE